MSPDEFAAFKRDESIMSGDISDFDAYRRLAGEAEARLTQARMKLTPAERLAQYPVSQFDVPVEQQIVRFGGGEARSVPQNELYRGLSQPYNQNITNPVEWRSEEHTSELQSH